MNNNRIKNQHFLGIVVLWIILLAGCKAETLSPTATLDTSPGQTQTAQSIGLQKTVQAGEAAVAQLTELARPTITPTLAPTLAPIATRTRAPSATPISPATATATLPPSPTPLPISPTASARCDIAAFVADLSVPDNTAFRPGETFTKTWRVRNSGSCEWTAGYALIYSSGEQMGGPNEMILPAAVPSGAAIDISLNLTAPAEAGTYAGFWALRNAAGSLFGMGETASMAFWVQIQVIEGTSNVLGMARNYCLAEWRTNSTWPIECPTMFGPQMDAGRGVIAHDETPRLENGSIDNERALIMHPQATEGGFITGEYPILEIHQGDRFKAVIGCLYGNVDCNVTFVLSYRIVGQSSVELGHWSQIYDDQITMVNENLSELAGKQVNLILTVLSNNSGQEDWAFWLAPRVER